MKSPITESLAALLLLVVFLKIAALRLRPDAWLALARWLYRHPHRTGRAALAGAALVLALLARSGLDIVSILAVCLFMSLMLIAGLAPYGPRLLDWIETQDLRRLIRQQLSYSLAWGALLLWGLIELLKPHLGG